MVWRRTTSSSAAVDVVARYRCDGPPSCRKARSPCLRSLGTPRTSPDGRSFSMVTAPTSGLRSVRTPSAYCKPHMRSVSTSIPLGDAKSRSRMSKSAPPAILMHAAPFSPPATSHRRGHAASSLVSSTTRLRGSRTASNRSVSHQVPHSERPEPLLSSPLPVDCSTAIFAACVSGPRMSCAVKGEAGGALVDMITCRFARGGVELRNALQPSARSSPRRNVRRCGTIGDLSLSLFVVCLFWERMCVWERMCPHPARLAASTFSG